MVDLQQREQRELPSAEAHDIFPLPLTPFEKYLIWDETALQPMTSFIELHFDSRLDLGQWKEALAEAVHRNPLLASQLVEHRGELYWEYDPGYRPQLRNEEVDPPLRNGWPVPIDLKNECGCRYWYRNRQSRTRLLFQLHHACTDGMGLRRVLIDALVKYSKIRTLQGSEQVIGRGWREPDIDRLPDRFDFSNAFRGPPTKPLSFTQRLQNAHYFHFQPPESLKGNSTASEGTIGADAAEPLRHIVIDREVSQLIMERATSQNLAINELALALLFQTCARWNSDRGLSNPRGRVRLLMPFDLRSRVDLRMPATNRLSFSFLGRTRAACMNWEALLEGVQSELKSIRESQLPMDFLNGISAAVHYPRSMHWILRNSNRMATSVLTYTGDVLRGTQKLFQVEGDHRLIGDAKLKNTLVAPPVRRNTNVSLGLCVNWGQLCISAAWNRESFTAQNCEAFLADYHAAWLAWLERQRTS